MAGIRFEIGKGEERCRYDQYHRGSGGLCSQLGLGNTESIVQQDCIVDTDEYIDQDEEIYKEPSGPQE